jgi:hypothetical protein
MRYSQRWTLAVALKQGYPRPETGAEDSTTAVGAPPVFAAPTSDEQKQKQWTFGAGGAALGLVLGAGLAMAMGGKRR